MLLQLCEFPVTQKMNLLYRASEHGFGCTHFHDKCDNHSKTLTVIRTANGNVFGGYTDQFWDTSNAWKVDNNAFIFSLINQENWPLKIKSRIDKSAIYCSYFYGPVFGECRDICIYPNSNNNESSFANLGCSFEHPTYVYQSSEANCFLAGSQRFAVSDIEVFQLV
jgi:hypothetical protein